VWRRNEIKGSNLNLSGDKSTGLIELKGMEIDKSFNLNMSFLRSFIFGVPTDRVIWDTLIFFIYNKLNKSFEQNKLLRLLVSYQGITKKIFTHELDQHLIN
jgi:hypothetical protein